MFEDEDFRPLKKKIHNIPEIKMGNSNRSMYQDHDQEDFKDYVQNRLNLDAYITHIDENEQNEENCDFNEEILSERVSTQKRNYLAEMKYYQLYGERRREKFAIFGSRDKGECFEKVDSKIVEEKIIEEEAEPRSSITSNSDSEIF